MNKDNNFESYWNEVHSKFLDNPNSNDNWIEKYFEKNQRFNNVLDLGCGQGYNLSILQKYSNNLYALDYSEVAINLVKEKFDGVKTIQFDLNNLPLPFENGLFDLIVADLSLHYFSSDHTIKLVKELKRIANKNCLFLIRVNSTKDLNYGANNGQLIEPNYYFVDGYNKRFFDIEECKKFFSLLGKLEILESKMTRYSKPKEVIEINITLQYL